MSIEVENIQKTFGDFTALEGIDLHIESGELVALLGPSGCGKTTLLRSIAGLDRPDAGRVRLAGEDMAARRVQERRVGFVFQHYALFKHMTVFDNVAFGLQVRPRSERPSKSEIRGRVEELLELVQLAWTAGRYPSQLSGGQQQRIALARALAVEPSVLLLDEPFGALDAKVRRELRRWMRRLHDRLHVTSVFVTHDQEEALEVADRIAIMREGRLAQVGTPAEVYADPASAFVYRFMGNVNALRGTVRAGKFDVGNGAAPFSVEGAPPPDGMEALGYVRPQDLALTRRRNGEPAVETTVVHVNEAGPVVRLDLRCAAAEAEFIEAELSRGEHQRLDAEAGDALYAAPRGLRVFSDE